MHSPLRRRPGQSKHSGQIADYVLDLTDLRHDERKALHACLFQAITFTSTMRGPCEVPVENKWINSGKLVGRDKKNWRDLVDVINQHDANDDTELSGAVVGELVAVLMAHLSELEAESFVQTFSNSTCCA